MKEIAVLRDAVTNAAVVHLRAVDLQRSFLAIHFPASRFPMEPCDQYFEDVWSIKANPTKAWIQLTARVFFAVSSVRFLLQIHRPLKHKKHASVFFHKRP